MALSRLLQRNHIFIMDGEAQRHVRLTPPYLISCCNQLVVTTDDSNGYAMPIEVVKGDPTGTTLTTRFNSDFNTSLQNDVTDPNSLVTTVYSRDARSAQHRSIDLPTTAEATTSYNDSTLSVTGSKVYDDDGTQKTVRGCSLYCLRRLPFSFRRMSLGA
jgi:hypothetical protein